MVERIHLEATLRSDFGVQRLSRGEVNEFNHDRLLPREPASYVSGQQVRWREGAFWFEVNAHAGFVTWLDTPTALVGRRKLVSGDRFKAGTTVVDFECSIHEWPVDLERERALIARDDDAAWSIYMDELLLRGDPLGSVLASKGKVDMAFHLDVHPLVVTNSISFVADERGLWRELTFRYDAADGYLEPGPIDAVLTHPRAWFVRRVTFEIVAHSAYRLDAARRVATQVNLSAGPYLETLSLPRFPEEQALPELGEAVRVDRSR